MNDRTNKPERANSMGANRKHDRIPVHRSVGIEERTRSGYYRCVDHRSSVATGSEQNTGREQ